MKHRNLQSASTLTSNSVLSKMRLRVRMQRQPHGTMAKAKALWNVDYVRLLRQFWNERGHSLVELAVVMPVLLVLFTTVVELGRMACAAIEVSRAANVGALLGSHHLLGAASATSLPPAPLQAVPRRRIC